MTAINEHPPLPQSRLPAAAADAPAVTRLLTDLRRRVRAYVWTEGAAATVATALLFFWGSLAIDWTFEPSASLRLLLLAAAFGLIATVFVRRAAVRGLAPLADASLALALERRFPAFGESLLTTVELQRRGAPQSQWGAAMFDRVRRTADDRATHVSAAAALDFQPLRLAVFVAAVLLVATGGFCLARPHLAGIWLRRSVLLSDELWPRRARLSVEGFGHGVAKIARGSDLEVVARADTGMPLVPALVQVRYRMEGGSRDSVPMTRTGVADRGKDPFQEYTYTFRGVLSSIRFDVVGGDDAVRNLWIQVVDSPMLLEPAIECRYPRYTGLPPRRLPLTGSMQVPAGSEVTFVAGANKDLAAIQIESLLEEPPPLPRWVAIDPQQPRAVRLPIGALRQDKTLGLTLADTDGIRNREPIRVVLAAVTDEPPRLALQLRGIGPAVTPQARLPVAGTISDDFGVAYAWFEFVADAQPPLVRPANMPSGNPIQVKVDDAMELRTLGLAAGAKLLVAVKAKDRCDLNGQPNVGTSERWLLDVVSPQQLRTLLETREMMLRQRFETIVQEVTETGELVGQIEFGAEDAAAAQRQAALRTLRIERASQNGRKNAHETLGLADAFDDIGQQLINNRIDTEELLLRLNEGIAHPLRQIGERMFPELDRLLEELRRAVDDPQEGPRRRGAAARQVGSILAAMRQVLERMLELESFNKVVEELRKIVEEQERLNEETRKRQKDKLRDLLKE